MLWLQLRRGSWLPAIGAHVKLKGHVSFPLRLDLRLYTGLGDTPSAQPPAAVGRATAGGGAAPQRGPPLDGHLLGKEILRRLQQVPTMNPCPP